MLQSQRQHTTGCDSAAALASATIGNGNDRGGYDLEDNADDDVAEYFFRAIAPHRAEQDNELMLAVGDLVTAVKDLGNGWLIGRKVGDFDNNDDDADGGGTQSGVMGIFPSDCVRPLLRNFGPFGSAQIVDDQYSASVTSAAFRHCVSNDEDDDVEETRRKLIVGGSSSERDGTGNGISDFRNPRRHRHGFRFRGGGGDDDDDSYDVGADVGLMSAAGGRQSDLVVGSRFTLQRASRAEQQQQPPTSTTGTGSGTRRLMLQRRPSSSSNGSQLGVSTLTRCADCGTEVNDGDMVVVPYGFSVAAADAVMTSSRRLPTQQHGDETPTSCVGQQRGSVGTAETDGKPRMIVKPNRECGANSVTYGVQTASVAVRVQLLYFVLTTSCV